MPETEDLQRKRFYYLFKIQYLGYRLHGWQKQPKLKTIESLITKTLKFVLPGQKLKILGSSRTDAMVSANESAFELFLDNEPLQDLNEFLQLFNKNLPQDIKALSVEEVNENFNIIQHPKTKEYAYLFSFGGKNHPFCAPLIANFMEDLDLEKMKIGAKLFEGTHNFKNYAVRVSESSQFTREILKSEIIENSEITASFFPKQSFLFHVHGQGFLRYQIRMMMGALVQVGRGELQLEEIEESLLPESNFQMDFIAPASGLILNKLEFSTEY